MASPSSFRPRNYSYNVFSSFHGPDVRKTLLSHIREQFNRNGITMFDDQKIVRGATIDPSLKEGIKESRISIVILSEKYASSSWCLDELVEILECKKDMGQIVMTIFYGVDPSDVRKQLGKFGIAFDETCARKTDEERQKWSKALNEVGNIAGEDFFRWDNEANMIKKIARDVSDKLNATSSRDFDGMVGLEAHLRKMQSLLDLDNDVVKMVAITGPAGIGKTTIARALQSLLSNKFQLTCFVDNLRGSYYSGLDEVRLQENFLSNILNQDGIRICHSGVIEERLCKQRVLIILDDVNNIKQLMALANETTWFGPGSRIVVTTENKELLQQHGINNTYHVGYPSGEEALKILCRYAFRQSSPRHGFEELAKSVTWLCGKLPLGLSVVGSSLRGKKEDEWEDVVRRLKTILDRDIEEVLSVGYESLDENEQTLFLHIAVFFNNIYGDVMETLLADSELDVKYGLKILENRSLIDQIEISAYGDKIIVMHRLLQQVGKKAIHKKEPWKRKILIDASEICDVLENAKGTRVVSGISFDISNIDEVSINERAFRRMPNLRFLRVYKSRDDGNYRMHIPEKMEFPRRLRLLDWEAYPSKSLPSTFNPEYLVELYMKESQLEYLWQGNQCLKNLKYMYLTASKNLKELPDLSKATNLEVLNLSYCESLVEIPSSFSHLHKLRRLEMNKCINLQVIPAHMNLASLKNILMRGCSRLRKIPLMSTNIVQLDITVEDVPPFIRHCPRLYYVSLFQIRKLKGLTHLPKSVKILNLSCSDIERIPDCIKSLHRLHSLRLSSCGRLASLPELPGSLKVLKAENCESLETVFCPLSTPNAEFNFTNCFKLGQQARRRIIRRSFCYSTTLLPGEEFDHYCFKFEQQAPMLFCYSITLLPGREVPAEFDHRAMGNTLTVVLDGNRSYSGFVFCVVISPNQQCRGNIFSQLSWRRIIAQDEGYPVDGSVYVGNGNTCQTEHLFIFQYRFREFYRPEVSREMMFEFDSNPGYFEIIECGAKILTQEESFERSYESGSSDHVPFEDDIEFEPSEEAFEDNTEYGGDPTNIDGEKHTNFWSWLFLCFGLSDFVSGRGR